MEPAAETPRDASAPLLYGAGEDVYEVRVHEPDAAPTAVPERMAQELWRDLRFERADLRTTAGARLEILQPGVPNDHQGPDFLGARLRLDGQEQTGDVEVHLVSAGWTQHGHHRDPRYNRVVLHVTLAADAATGGLRRQDGALLPELVLGPRLRQSVRSLLYDFRLQQPESLPCHSLWPELPAAEQQRFLRARAAERCEARRDALAGAVLRGAALDELLYQEMMHALGFAPNAEAMRALARRAPLERLRRLDADADAEALLFGAAGLLPTPEALLGADRPTVEYARALAERYAALQAREPVPEMPGAAWQFFRLRPSNFPTLRIAQACALVRGAGSAFGAPDAAACFAEAFRSPAPVAALRALLRRPPGAFWQRHLRLDRACKPHTPTLGQGRADALIIHAAAPAALLLAMQRDDLALEAAVYDTLALLPPEQDAVTRLYGRLGLRPASALDSQGMHALYRSYCTARRCPECAVGARCFAPPAA